MKSERISPFWVGGYHPFSALNRMTGYNVRTINHYNYLYIYFYDNTAHTEP